MLQVLWETWKCFYCDWRPETRDRHEAERQVHAHLQEHTGAMAPGLGQAQIEEEGRQVTEQEQQKVFETAVGQAKAQRDAGELRLKLDEAEGEARREAEKAAVLPYLREQPRTGRGDPREAQEALRDQFAAAALTALIAKVPLYDRRGEIGIAAPSIEEIHQVRRDIAQSAYDYADAMVEAREQR